MLFYSYLFKKQSFLESLYVAMGVVEVFYDRYMTCANRDLKQHEAVKRMRRPNYKLASIPFLWEFSADLHLFLTASSCLRSLKTLIHSAAFRMELLNAVLEWMHNCSRPGNAEGARGEMG